MSLKQNKYLKGFINPKIVFSHLLNNKQIFTSDSKLVLTLQDEFTFSLQIFSPFLQLVPNIKL